MSRETGHAVWCLDCEEWECTHCYDFSAPTSAEVDGHGRGCVEHDRVDELRERNRSGEPLSGDQTMLLLALWRDEVRDTPVRELSEVDVDAAVEAVHRGPRFWWWRNAWKTMVLGLKSICLRWRR